MKLPFLFILLLVSYVSSSQCLSNDPDIYGAIDFTNTQFTIEKYVNPVTGSSEISYLKDNNNDGIPEINPNMKDVRYPKTTKDETCNPTTYDSVLNPATITYVVYYPKTRVSSGVDVSGCKFPAIILFHGGGFADCNGGGGDAQ